MNGLLRRLTRRRAAPADETPPSTPAASEPADASAVPTADEPLSAEQQEEAAREAEAAREKRVREEERMRRERDVPAGLDAGELESPLDSGARRGRTRRRIRYLRHAREVLLRDLGGFFYEVHRTAAGHQSSGHRTILETKTSRLAAVDSELRELETRLGEAAPVTSVVREPGVGGTCHACGELHGSEAHFCSNCGSPLSDAGTRRYDEAVDRTIAAREAPPAPEGESEAAPAPESPGRRWGWPRRGKKLEPDPTGDAPAATDDTVALPAQREEPHASGERAARDESSAEPTGRDERAARDESSAEPTGRDERAGRGEAAAEPAGADESAARGDDPPTRRLSDENGSNADTPTFAERRS